MKHHPPLPPPKVIKSILKKNGNRTSSNKPNSIPRQIIHDLPVDTDSDAPKQQNSILGNEMQNTNAHSTQTMSNGVVKRVHLDNKEDSCIQNTNLKNEDKQSNKLLPNGVSFKLSKNLQTVHVDIH